jgi:hypothetical protein
MSDKAFAVQSFRERLPRPELRPFVTCVWMQEVAHDSSPYPYQSLPNGSSELVWELGSAPKFIGPQTRPRETLLPPGTVTIGVRFRPAARLTAPVPELVDLETRRDDLHWPHRDGLRWPHPPSGFCLFVS